MLLDGGPAEWTIKGVSRLVTTKPGVDWVGNLMYPLSSGWGSKTLIEKKNLNDRHLRDVRIRGGMRDDDPVGTWNPPTWIPS